MSVLYIYIPFTRHSEDVDLRKNATEAENVRKMHAPTMCGKSIDSIKVVYKNEERNLILKSSDVLVVHAFKIQSKDCAVFGCEDTAQGSLVSVTSS